MYYYVKLFLVKVNKTIYELYSVLENLKVSSYIVSSTNLNITVLYRCFSRRT